MYKYDLHIHTSETSPCGMIAATDMIKVYKEKGYQGLVITDHYRKIFFRKSHGANWDEKVDDFLEGYQNAKEEARKYDMDVLLGIEIAFMENNEKANDYLVYGITEEMLKKPPNLLDLGIVGLSKFCRENDLLLYQAHPLRGYCYLEDIALLDGVEVHNGNPRHNSNNDKTEKIAKEHDLLMISGSDYHEIGDEDCGGIITSKRIKTNEDLIKVLKNRDYTLFRGNK